jgi:hypothetical protein
MIQRIQTVYLLAIVALITAMLFMPLAIIQLNDLFYSFDGSGLNTLTKPSELVYPAWALMALLTIIIIIAFVTIFMYKKRMLQIRLCIFNALLLIGFYGLFAFTLWEISKTSGVFHFSSVRLALSFPFICLILDYLAIRNIGADETLVRSLKRLRK